MTSLKLTYAPIKNVHTTLKMSPAEEALLHQMMSSIPYPADKFCEHFTTGWIVTALPDLTVGITLSGPISPEWDAPCAHLYSCVAEQWRGKGLARQVIEDLAKARYIYGSIKGDNRSALLCLLKWEVVYLWKRDGAITYQIDTDPEGTIIGA